MAGYVAAGADLIDIMGGGELDNNTSSWLTQQYEQVTSVLSHTGQAFFNNLKDMYRIVSGSDAAQILRNIRGKAETIWSNNQIAALETLTALQTAGPYMQRWIMAEPTIRKRYLNQQLDGYSGSYENCQGDKIGDAQLDYRMVMNGVVVASDDADQDFFIRHYYDMLGDESELKPFEQRDIISTWAKVRHFMEQGGEDPTSVTGAQL